MNIEEARTKFGQRIQRCYSCFVAFYLKDMWLAEDGSFHCGSCRDESMFHFDDFSRRIDPTMLPGVRPDDEPTH